MTDDAPISYEAAARGTPVLSSAGTQIGTLEHVLEVPELDVFGGIVIATPAGLRFIGFIDADYVRQITRGYIRCSLDDTQAAQLTPPQGSPVYHVDALADSGFFLTASVILFGLSAVAALLHSLGTGGTAAQPFKWWDFLAIALPAVAGALSGYGAQRDYARHAERFRLFAASLDGALETLLSAQDLDGIQQAALAISRSMRDEATDR
jgi:hypothetical protein